MYGFESWWILRFGELAAGVFKKFATESGTKRVLLDFLFSNFRVRIELRQFLIGEYFRLE